MPAPKAVLRDIADNKLDPSKRHHRITSTGRLAHQASDEIAVENLRSGLVKIEKSNVDEKQQAADVEQPEVVKEVAAVVDEKKDEVVVEKKKQKKSVADKSE